ncbi:MAG TPA: alkaline phosphatase family protein [Opitutaceae bacterium]|jgi:phospholipase C|nr:alkaline phosphatase family protein [Opitutaceae bacterium]
MGLENIDHIVVLMMENRSLDNLLGWLYPSPGTPPPSFYPHGSNPSFDGLSPSAYFNQLDSGSPKVYASHPPTSWPSCPQFTQTPTPDPHEEFEFVTKQLFGDKAPVPGILPDMSGFLSDYATTAAGTGSAGQMMQSFGPDDVPVICRLARSFAVSDRWFASAPTQTWPNRGFVHSGSSDGHINNENYEPYANRTIFNALEDAGKSWGVFHDTDIVPSLTHVQFLQLWDKEDNFQKFDEFTRLCAAPAASAQKLPSYSFLEPRFVPEPGEWWRFWRTKFPSDYHPPHDVLRGEQFLAKAYEAVRSSPYRDRILMVVTFDEHGGCYDHVPPPWGSAAPEPGKAAAANGFGFDRFGVRIPTLLISSCVESGTVFRSDGNVPFDHASILATVRDWMGLGNDPDKFLPSPRIHDAPKLDGVLKATPVNTSWPSIPARSRMWWKDTSKDTQLNDVQKSLLAHMKRRDSADAGASSMSRHANETRGAMHTIQHALDYLRKKPPAPSKAKGPSINP